MLEETRTDRAARVRWRAPSHNRTEATLRNARAGSRAALRAPGDARMARNRRQAHR